MTTPNCLPSVDVRNYRAVIIAGRYVVTYEQRQPGAVDWQPVCIERAARPEDVPAPHRRQAG
jgi:hypothetical protein